MLIRCFKGRMLLVVVCDAELLSQIYYQLLQVMVFGFEFSYKQFIRINLFEQGLSFILNDCPVFIILLLECDLNMLNPLYEPLFLLFIPLQLFTHSPILAFNLHQLFSQHNRCLPDNYVLQSRLQFPNLFLQLKHPLLQLHIPAECVLSLMLGFSQALLKLEIVILFLVELGLQLDLLGVKVIYTVERGEQLRGLHCGVSQGKGVFLETGAFRAQSGLLVVSGICDFNGWQLCLLSLIVLLRLIVSKVRCQLTWSRYLESALTISLLQDSSIDCVPTDDQFVSLTIPLFSYGFACCIIAFCSLILCISFLSIQFSFSTRILLSSTLFMSKLSASLVSCSRISSGGMSQLLPP
ncbi:hypothetical protein FGO68_gene12085 [Halteria grandinella]|uniref:Uncharacterized protein n=1 Tax=Halteria grandinella TaxID=5974 RepID=A0A8J8NQN0_HALGN|nr:hypothetical protein FGO68_gene12085 [Halteria grandinella]